ncbi:MAG: ABC transporter substrate-binding protein [Gammaproteobacteria bacterium]|nr:ABC transporter substrate-binding protein [Gammaproteobacteria bacterium]MDE0509248.1 ABC transporter substrate-binding protein [Gammaproteobacteria bacterium]MXX05652.1 ABC transporter substrate-binding protein [Gammaproteobacteria bacterium]MYA37649.1 ABC transporter substrate-binding protein [Gammaproteobacteria bacterium]MYA67150.1 ABC transporter substrate-binding protein [Gammaproteobacteria bacterium]
MSRRKQRAAPTRFLFLAALLCFPAALPAADDPVILFGQSAALTGPTSELGTGMKLGLDAAFNEINANGGIHGYQLRLTSLDDGYEPEAAIVNTRRLIEEEQVFALIGPVGTPTSTAAQPIATEAGVPYIGAFTGAEFLRDAEALPNVINVRASYFQETEEMAARLSEDLGFDTVSIFYQDDSYGRAGLAGLRRAVDIYGMEIGAEVSYPRNTEAVKLALLDLRRAGAEAVVIIGAYQPASTMIRWARKLDYSPYFVNISFIGSEALARTLGEDGAGVYVTQVVPFPEDASLPVVAEYQAALRRIDSSATPSFVSLEGYLAGRLAAEGLRLAGPEPTREGFLRSLKTSGEIDLSGFSLSYGMNDNQGSDQVYLTVIDENGDFASVNAIEPR